MAIIEAEGLTKTYRVLQKREGLGASIRSLFRREYRVVEAVRGVDLRVEAGEFVAFLGPNGAGKTTTLKLLSGVVSPTSGSARVMGFVPWERKIEYRRRFALVMGQKNQLWWDLPANESFRLHQQMYRLDRADYERNLEELTDLLDTRRLLNQPVRELSLGERMKMELTAALLHAPEVLFLDEPTIGLDVVAQHNIQQFLKRYQQQRGVTILLTSHYMKDVAALCRRAVIIARGRVRYDGSLAGVIDRFSAHKLVTLQFAEADGPTAGFLDDAEGARRELSRFGEVVAVEPPRARLRIPREEAPQRLASLLAWRPVEDVAVEDVPLEEVVAQFFAEVEQRSEEAGSAPPGREA